MLPKNSTPEKRSCSLWSQKTWTKMQTLQRESRFWSWTKRRTRRTKEKARNTLQGEVSLFQGQKPRFEISSMLSDHCKELLENFYQISPGTEKLTKKSGEYRPWANSNSSPLGRVMGVRDPKREQNLCREISLIILDAIVEFIQDFKEEMKTRSSAFLTRSFAIFTSLMQKEQSVSVLSCIFATLAYYAAEFKRYVSNVQTIYWAYRPLFRYSSTICGDLAFETLKYCNTKTNITRAEACSLLYLLISVSG